MPEPLGEEAEEGKNFPPSGVTVVVVRASPGLGVGWLSVYRLGSASTTVIVSVCVAEDCWAVRSRSKKELTILGTSAARLEGLMFRTSDMSAGRLLTEAVDKADMPRKRAMKACILKAREACWEEMMGRR